MPWEETSPDRYERPFNGIELFYRAAASGGAPLEQWSVTAVAQIRLSLPASDKAAALRHAWKIVRRNRSCDVAQRYFLRSTLADREYSFLDLHPVLICYSPLPTANIRSGHSLLTLAYTWLGALHLLHQFFNALAEPHSIVFGTEFKNLSPSLLDAASIPTDVTPEIQQAVAGSMTNFASNQPSLGLPTIASTQIPGPTQRRELELGTERTCAAVKACKDHGVDVTSAVHAALILATQQVAHSEFAGRKYTIDD